MRLYIELKDGTTIIRGEWDALQLIGSNVEVIRTTKDGPQRETYPADDIKIILFS